MCKNGLNEQHLKQCLHMTKESLSLSSDWLCNSAHMAGAGHLELANAAQLERAEDLLKEAIALIAEVDDSIAAEEHTHHAGFEVELV